MLRRAFLATLGAVAALPFLPKPRALPRFGGAAYPGAKGLMSPVRGTGCISGSVVVVKDEGVYAMTANGPMRLGRGFGAFVIDKGWIWRKVTLDA